MVNCVYCGSDDVAYETSEELKTPITKFYKFKVWACIFLCRCCQMNFSVDLDDEDRKEWL